MRKKAGSLFTIGIIIILWFCISNYGNISDILLPKPQNVWKTFLSLANEGYGATRYTLMEHITASMGRLLIAFFFCIITAIPLGLLSGYFFQIASLIDPVVEFYRPIPPLAYYTLLVLWLGITENSKIMLLYLAGFAPIYIACSSGVKKIGKEYINTSYVLGANKLQTFVYVIFPAALPDIFTGIRTALGVEYTTLVAAEMVAAKTGIGWMVLDASNWLKSDVVFAGVIIMGVTGIILNGVILLLEHRIVHWAGKST